MYGFISVIVIKYPKSNLEEKLFWPMIPGYSLSKQGNSIRSLRQLVALNEEKQREVNTCMFASLPMLASYTVQDPCLENSAAYSWLDLPTSINPRDIPVD